MRLCFFFFFVKKAGKGECLETAHFSRIQIFTFFLISLLKTILYAKILNIVGRNVQLVFNTYL